eukprot:scaffold60957_cov72-Phaeocystis_antarctica.AAC.2
MLQCGACARATDIAELDVLVIGLPGREAARLARQRQVWGADDSLEAAASTLGNCSGASQ